MTAPTRTSTRRTLAIKATRPEADRSADAWHNLQGTQAAEAGRSGGHPCRQRPLRLADREGGMPVTRASTRRRLRRLGIDPHGPIPWPPKLRDDGRYEVACDHSHCGCADIAEDLLAAWQWVDGHVRAARLVREVAEGSDLL